MHASDGFVPLAAWLRPPRPEPAPPPEPVAEAPIAGAPDADHACAEALVAARIFRASLADVLAAAEATLLRELACAVLGRELLLAPADTAALAARLLAEHAAANPLRLRVAPADAPGVDMGGLPVVPDPALAPGDAMLELADGEIDARLGVRLSAVLRAWT